ncbi:MAG: PqqD family protein [Solobacterium sp.]|nr:PqqD family protein [Solobacterium sp.]
MMYRACPGIILTSVGEQYYLVSPKSRDQINETAAFYWSLLSEGTTVQKLKNAVIKEYSIDDSEELEEEIKAFIKELQKGHLIEQIPEQNGED